MSIFARLGYDAANTSSVVSDLSPAAIQTMSNIPPLLNEWQTTDASNSDTSGYFVNPVATVSQNLWNTANSIISITGLSSVANLTTVVTATNNLNYAANNFLGHTNRISGMVQPNEQTATLPHYSTAIGISKVIMQITFQSDGVQNNAPMMGNFTSLTVGDTLNTSYSTVSGYPNTIINSISTDGLGNYYTSLTSTQINTIKTNLQSVADLMNARRTGDVNFFNNCRSVASDYNTLKAFSSPGQTESYLFQNYIGSAKLLSRLNS